GVDHEGEHGPLGGSDGALEVDPLLQVVEVEVAGEGGEGGLGRDDADAHRQRGGLAVERARVPRTHVRHPRTPERSPSNIRSNSPEPARARARPRRYPTIA